ncbi:MAG: hypothetical protein AB1631_13475 [Acidobacteriota bacterium]
MKKNRIFNQTQIESLRAQTFERVVRKELLLKDAALILQLSYPQAKRLFARFEDSGLAGLAHLLRGKPSNRSFDPLIKQEIICLYKERFADFGPTFAVEKLQLLGYNLSPETLRLWLIEEGLWEKGNKRSPHRSWRPRRSHFGELVQMDGSHHHWFEERGEQCCLMNMVDDAIE